MSDSVLQGPFLTRRQAADRAEVPETVLVHRPDLLKVGSRWLPEVYFAFQFDRNGVRRDLGSVVQILKRKRSDMEIATWLVRPNSAFDLASPLKYLNSGGSVDRVVAAAEWGAPIAASAQLGDRHGPKRRTADYDAPSRARRPRQAPRRAVSGRFVMGSR